jgi:hypothetical protein
VGLFTSPCPVDAREQKWIEESLTWLRTVFGEPRPVVESLDGDVFAAVCRRMEVDPATITVELYGDTGAEDLSRAAGLTYRSHGAAGHYRRVGGHPVVAIDQTLAPTPLIATTAHELGHVRLDALNVIRDRADHEPLTDLLTVHFGLGIFAANAAFDFSQDSRRWSTRRLGYLTEPMYGYALACHAWLRGERQPAWTRRLDTNPRVYLRRGLRHLARHAAPARLAYDG